MTVVGDGVLADGLRARPGLSPTDVAVVIPPMQAIAGPFVELTDDQFASAWELPMRSVITTLQRVRRLGATRIVVVVPVVGLSGGRNYAATAGTAEAIRATVKSAARQWGAEGITVNTVAVLSACFGLDGGATGPAAIAPASLGAAPDVAAAIEAFALGAAAHVTGQTLVVDGGTWMP